MCCLYLSLSFEKFFFLSLMEVICLLTRRSFSFFSIHGRSAPLKTLSLCLCVCLCNERWCVDTVIIGVNNSPFFSSSYKTLGWETFIIIIILFTVILYTLLYIAIFDQIFAQKTLLLHVLSIATTAVIEFLFCCWASSVSSLSFKFQCFLFELRFLPYFEYVQTTYFYG